MLPGDLTVDVRGRDPRPERDRVAAERDGDPRAALEEVEPARAALGLRIDERGALLAPRVEHVARTRLDDDGETQLVQQRARREELRVRRMVGMQMVRV